MNHEHFPEGWALTIQREIAVPTEARRLVKVLESIASGKPFLECLKEQGFTYIQFKDKVRGSAMIQVCLDVASRMSDEIVLLRAEQAAVERAIDGVDEDVYFKGTKVGKRKVRSDSLLQTVLKSSDPDKYAERKHVKAEGIQVNLNLDGLDTA